MKRICKFLLSASFLICNAYSLPKYECYSGFSIEKYNQTGGNVDPYRAQVLMDDFLKK